MTVGALRSKSVRSRDDVEFVVRELSIAAQPFFLYFHHDRNVLIPAVDALAPLSSDLAVAICLASLPILLVT